MTHTFTRVLGIFSALLFGACGSTANSATSGSADASADTGPIGITATGIAAPSAFSCTSASKSAAGFSWQKSATAGVVAYVVERASLAGDFVAQPAVDATATTFADLTVAQFTSYRYRVRAKVGDQLGDSSNEVTVGPPATGFHVAAASTAGAEATFGAAVDLAIDGNGDPAVIFLDGSALQFVGWDRRSGEWKAPQKVTSSLSIGGAGSNVATLGFDRAGSSGTYAVVWARADGQEIDWALSGDGGKTWKEDTIAVAPVKSSFSQPTLVMGSSKAHIAWLQDGARLFYATGTLSTPPKMWTARKEAPVVASADTLLPFAPAIALDGAQQPAVGYFCHSKDGGVIATYWQPGNANATQITNSVGFADPNPSLSLGFSGQAPRAAVTLHRSATTAQAVWFVTSADGNSWSDATALPVDGTGGGGLFTRMVTDAKGASAVVYASSTPSGGKCGEPKLALSNDGKAWNTCSPDSDGSHGKIAQFSRIALGSDGKRYVAWQDPSVGGGVIAWREP